MSPAQDKDEIKTIPPFPLRMIGPYTHRAIALLADGSIVTVSIDRDSWGTPEEPFIQVFIDRYTEARLPFPAHHRQDNCVRSVKDIDKAMSRILNRRPAPRFDAASEGNGMPRSEEGHMCKPASS